MFRRRQRRLVAIADKALSEEADSEPLEKPGRSLKTAWTSGTPRPTEQRPAPKVRWWRSRKDPFEHTWPALRRWVEAEPDLTARELLQRLQADYPGTYPEGQLRTLQRRLKVWRSEMARELIFGTSAVPNGAAIGAATSAPTRPDPKQRAIARAAILDRRCAQWPPNYAGRDGRMLAARVEQTNGLSIDRSSSNSLRQWGTQGRPDQGEA